MPKDTKSNKPILQGGLSRRAFVAAGAAAAASTAFVPKTVFAAKKVTVKYTLAWLPEGANIWSYAAKQFWEKDGIEVIIEKGSGSAAATQSIAQGAYEFGIPASPNSIQQAMKGLPLMHLACLNYDTTMGIGVKSDSPIASPKDLEGKRVGSTVTSGEYPFLEAFYKNAGVDASTIKSIALDNQVRERALLEDQVDAITCFATSATPKIMAAGVTPRYMLYSKFGLPFYAQSLTTTPAFYEKEKALCEAMTQGICEGVKFTLLNPEATMEIMFKEVQELALSSTAKEQIVIGMGLWGANSLRPEAMEKSIGYTDPAVYAKMIDLIHSASAQPGDTKPDAANLMTNDYVGGVTLTAAEWDQVKEQVAKYAAILG